jgi:Ca2+-binding RTX toxin-like protein
VVVGKSTRETSADGAHRKTWIDAEGDGDNDRFVKDDTEIVVRTVNGVTVRDSVRTVETRAMDGTGAENGTLLSKAVTTSSEDGLRQNTVTTVQGDGVNIPNIVTWSYLTTERLATGETQRTTAERSQDGGLLRRQVVTLSEDRLKTVTELDANGDQQIDSRVTRVVQAGGNVVVTTQKLGVGGVEISKVVETAKRNGQDVWVQQDLDGDNDFDVKSHRTSVVNADGSVTTEATVIGRDNADVSRTKAVVSADGMVRQTFSDLDISNAMTERSGRQVTVIGADGTKVTTEGSYAGGNYAAGTIGTVLLGQTQVRVSDDGLKTTVLSNADGDADYDRISVSEMVLSNDGSGRKTVVKTGLAAANNDLGTVFTTTEDVIKDKGRTREQSLDVNGDGHFDTVIRTEVAGTGVRTETRTELDRYGHVMWSSKKVTTADGLRTTTSVDADGNGQTDATTVELTTLNADGSKRETVSNYGRVADPTYDGNGTETLNSKTIVTTSANGHKVIADQDIDGDGFVDLRTVSVNVIEADGDRVTTVTRNTGPGTTKIGQEITTASRNGRSVTVESDLDGNGKTDLVSQSRINADGTKTTTVTYQSSEEVTVAKSVTLTSANGFESTTLKDTNGDGENDLIIRQIKVLENDGDARTSTTVDNNRNERLGSITETKSLDGLHSSVVLDWDGRDGTDFRNESDRVYKSNGDVVDTMVSLDGLSTIRSTIVSTTSGNGLERYVTTDFNGDNSVDRILDSKTAADGSKVVTTTEFTPGLDTRRETTVTTSASGRDSATKIDLNGDGFTDRQSISHVDLDRTTRTTFSEVLLNGDIGDYIVETTNFNGTVHRFQFDVGGGNAPEFARETTVAYDAAGRKITSFTETYGDRTVYVSRTATSQNGLHTRVDIDTDGDGTTDAVTLTDTKINANGSRTTASETTYTKEFDNDVRSSSVVWISSDGRETRTRMDYDGNGIDDTTGVLKVGSDGSRVETQRNYDKAGGVLGDSVTETSADGLITTIARQGNMQVIIRSAVGGGSYVWKGGNEVGYEQTEVPLPPGSGFAALIATGGTGSYTTYVRTLTQKEVVHEVDAFGIESWRYTQRETVGTALTTTVFATRLDTDAKARIIAEAARVYDAALDRGMDFSESEVLVKYVVNGELNRYALAKDLMESDEFTTKYGALSRAEFINQIYHNTFGRGATLGEASEMMADLEGGLNRFEVIRDLAEKLEHVIVGNGHMSTNNFDAILNPVMFDRSLDRAFVQEQVGRLVDIVYDRQATDNELSVLSAKLMGGTQTLSDLAQMLLDTEGRLFGGRTSAISSAMTSTFFVRNAFENAYGRLPTETEELRWVGKLDQGWVSKAGLVLLLANSVDHVADGNRPMPGAAVTPFVTKTGDGTSQVMSGTVDQDELKGMGGSDTLNGSDGADRLFGGTGADSLLGGRGQDRYVWQIGEGSDTIDDNDVSQITTDTLVLQDVLSGAVSLERSGNNLLVRIGTETITIKDRFQDAGKGLGIEVIQFQNGEQWDLRKILNETKSAGMVGSDYRDSLKGNDSANTLDGNGGRDTLAGGKGNDILNGGTGGDRYVWVRGDGDDTINEGADAAGVVDVLDLSSISVNAIFNVVRIDDKKSIRIFIDSATGPSIVIRDQFNDAIVGGGIERILFSDGVWTLHDLIRKSNFNGGTASETLTGSNFDDFITGGDGSDMLSGGFGDDTLFGEEGADLLEGGVGGDLYIWNRGHGDDTVNDWGNRGAGTDVLQLLNVRSDFVTFVRANGKEDLQIRVMITDPQNSAKKIVSFTITDKDFFSATVAGRGIDRILLSDGVIWGRDDILDRAVAYGGADPATLNGTELRDRLSGGNGSDILNGNAGADTLVGGLGDDIMNGGSGSDRYIWNPTTSPGHDVIKDLSDHAGDIDTLRLNNVDANDVRMARSTDNKDLLIKVTVGPDVYTIRDVNRFDESGSGGIEVIEFDNGEKIRVRNSAQAVLEWTGTAGADTRTIADSWAYGDLLYGLAGNDTLHGGAGGADTLIGGKGDDSLNGHTGTDVYKWALEDGNDTINDTGTSLNEADRLILDIGASSTITLRRYSGSDNLRINITNGGTTETIIISAQYSDTATGQGIEVIQLSDGTIWTLDDIIALTGTYGTNASDTLDGTRYRDNIYGGLGADKLSGFSGGDHLDGGTNGDLLIGGGGSDVYHWVIGDGNDTIDDGVADAGQADILALDNIDAPPPGTSVWLRRGAAFLSVNITRNGVTEMIRIEGQFSDTAPGSGIEGIKFADGVIWTLDDILERTQWQTSELAETVEGSNLRDNIYGRGGDDLISGLSGGDHLYGGTGTDTLNGGAGSDWYWWATGDGNDWVQDLYSNADHVDVLNLTGAGDVTLSRDHDAANPDFRDDLIVRFTVNGTSQTIRIVDQFAELGSGKGIERIITGTLDLNLGEILALTKAIGTANADTINGTGFTDNLFGGDGADKLLGKFGQDVLFGGVGSDTLDGGEGDDDASYAGLTIAVNVDLSRTVAQFGGPTDSQSNGDVLISIEGVIGSNSGDTLAGDAASNALDGGAGSDKLYGRGGFDRLYGGDGNDMLNGGEGADVLNGGAGADRFVFDVNAGEDTISVFNAEEGDRIEFRRTTVGNGAFAIVTAFTGGADNPEARLVGDRLLIDTNGDAAADIWININSFAGATAFTTGAFVVLN